MFSRARQSLLVLRQHLAPTTPHRYVRQSSVLSFLMGNEASSIPPASECLPGSESKVPVTNVHFITSNPIQGPFEEGLEVAVFGTGCFWGTEKGFWRLPGVYSTAVGYISGHTKNPSYKQVCSGQTGHNEVVQVVYDPKKVAFVDLLGLFWASHDPTQGMGQGNDRGTQYRSGIYCYHPQQKELAEASKVAYEATLKHNNRGRGEMITTEIIDPAPEFFFAEDYHQQYLAKPGNRQYCSAMPTGTPLPPYSEWKPDGVDGKEPFLPKEFWAAHGPQPGCTIAGPNAQIIWP